MVLLFGSSREVWAKSPFERSSSWDPRRMGSGNFPSGRSKLTRLSGALLVLIFALASDVLYLVWPAMLRSIPMLL